MSRGYYDAAEGAELEAGMYLQTPTNGRTWRITSARKMRSKYPNRWAIEMERVDPEEVEPHEFVLPFFWYRREKKKET